MLTPGLRLSLDIEKPAAGGRMIARVGGQVVLVAGAIPGERVSARIERVGKGVAYAQTIEVEVASPDRRTVAGDPLCGGCVYAPIAYPRQLQIKAQVIADALVRIGRIPWLTPIDVAASPESGYRMRARLHYRDRRLGLFREGSHQVCAVRGTAQLLTASNDLLDRVERSLREAGIDSDVEIELSENIAAEERVIHLESTRPIEPQALRALADDAALTGLSVSEQMSPGTQHASMIAGDPRVRDVMVIEGRELTLSRHVLAFFQGNRFLLETLLTHVVNAIGENDRVIDLYAGAGLFAVSAASVKGARVVAVEGDSVSSADLSLNAVAVDGAVEALHQSVEAFTAQRHEAPNTIVVDPPRTGMSKEALQGVIRLGAGRIVYVSCDVATLGRDARGLLDAGYQLTQVDGFDLFPNTPHVETVAIFERA